MYGTHAGTEKPLSAIEFYQLFKSLPFKFGHMFKSGFFAALLMFFACFGNAAQAQDVIYSPYNKFDFRNGEYSVVGMCGGRLYTYYSDAKNAYLDAYDDSMNKLATVMLDFFPEKIYQVKFITYPDKMMVLYQSVESNHVVQYVAVLDGAGRLKKNPVKLEEVKAGIFGPTKNYFSSVISEDKKTIVVYSTSGKGGDFELDGKWLDDDGNVTKRSHATFHGDNDLSHGEANVANNGDVYVSAYTAAGGRGFADQFFVLRLEAGSNKFDAHELPLMSNYAGNIFLKIDNPNNRIYTGGFYSDKKNGDYTGVIYGYYDIAGASFQNLKMIPFDNQVFINSGARSKKHAFDNYQVRQLIVKNDGGFVLVSEAFYVTTRNNYMPGFGYYSWYYNPYSASIVNEYHYNDIMALSYKADGTNEWSAFIPKEQYSVEDGGLFSSYALLNTGGTLAFLFNDFNNSHSRIQLAALDNGGHVTMNSFTAQGNDNPDWMPRAGKQVASRAIVVPCLRKKQICFAKVVF